MVSGTISEIKSHPKIQETNIDESILKTLNIHDLSAVLGFSPKAVENLLRLCKEHSAKIVISSGWGSNKNLTQLKALFSIAGFGEYIFDSIPEISGKHVEHWLVTHSRKINSFVILDTRDKKLSTRFKERYVPCEHLFSDNDTAKKASDVLQKPYRFENSVPKLIFDAIERNSSQITEVTLNKKLITAIKIGFGWNTQTFIDNIFAALEKNQFITRLTLQDFYQDERDISSLKKLNKDLLQRIASLLQNSPMKLQYLNIAHNDLQGFNELLSVIDGHQVHIPHLCFNHNPLEGSEQKSLAQWMINYPHPIKIDLDTSESGWGRYNLDGCIINALEQNENITICTKKELFSAMFTSINKTSLNNLIDLGRIELVSIPEKEKLVPEFSFY